MDLDFEKWLTVLGEMQNDLTWGLKIYFDSLVLELSSYCFKHLLRFWFDKSPIFKNLNCPGLFCFNIFEDCLTLALLFLLLKCSIERLLKFEKSKFSLLLSSFSVLNISFFTLCCLFEKDLLIFNDCELYLNYNTVNQ